MNGAQALIKVLEDRGVEIIFGYPGGAVLPLYDELPHSKIKHVLTRGEQSAAHAACGYARSTGKVGVCIATSGPGATNLITGIANAYLDSTPLIAITGQVATELIGHDVFQEVDIVGATTPFTKQNYLIKETADIPGIVNEAFYLASTGRKGPILIDLPVDIQRNTAHFEFNPVDRLRSYKPNTEPNARQLKRLEEAIRKSSKPLLCVGGGCMLSDVSDKIIALAQKINAPFVTTLVGIGSVPTNHENCLGMIGQTGLNLANSAVEAADLIIVLGARLGDRATGKSNTFAQKAKIVHIDIDPAEIGKNHDTYIPIVADLDIALTKILEMDIEAKTSGLMEDIPKWQDYPESTGACGTNGLDPKEIIECLSNSSDENVILTTDVGQHQIWAGRFFRTKAPRSFITSGGLGTMAFSLPSAIGAKFGNPGKRIVTVVGDGGFQMCLNELATMKQENLKIGIALFNNNCLGMVRELQQFFCGGRYSQVHFEFEPDFSLVSAAYGIEYLKVEKPEEITAAVQRLLNPEKLVIVEFAIDPCANVKTVKSGEQT